MTRVFWRGVRCAWLPREVEEGCGQTTPQSAPHSMAPQSARYEERECCGHNHEIEPRAVQAEIHDGNEEHRKHENPRYSCDRCYRLKSPVEARFRVSTFADV